MDYSKRYTSEKFRVLKLVVNRGKGGAVREVFMYIQGGHKVTHQC